MNTAHRFYIGDVLLPQTPAEFSVQGSDNNVTFQTARGGPVTIPLPDGPQSYSFSFTVPVVDQPYLWNGVLESPKFYTDLLWNLKNDRTPTKLTILRQDGHSYTLPVLLKDYSYTESAEDADAFTFDVTFIDYYPWHNQEVDVDIQHHLIQTKNARGWTG